MFRFIFAIGFLAAFNLFAADIKIPPAPKAYVNDYAKVLPDDAEKYLNERLAKFERETSNQVVVAVFQSLNGANLEEFASKTFKAWGVGQKSKNNGVVLFVFIQDRKMRIEVGYGLEGALTDYACKRIINERITPLFKRGDFYSGISGGVEGIIAATRGEYKNAPLAKTGGNQALRPQFTSVDPDFSDLWPVLLFFGILIALIVLAFWYASKHGMIYSGGGVTYGNGRRSSWDSGSSSSWSSSSSSSWGSSSSSSSSSFSGGGGSSGGGGASGSW